MDEEAVRGETPEFSEAVEAVDKPDDLLRPGEAAAFLQIGKPALYRQVFQRRIKPIRVRGRLFFRVADLLAYREHHTGMADGEAVEPDETAAEARASDTVPRSDPTAAIVDIMKEIVPPGYADDHDAGSMVEQAPIIRMANAILVQAIQAGASDIHIEPYRRSVWVRFRIDGVLHEMLAIPKHIEAPLIARYRIMADLYVRERSIPQEGVIPVRHEDKEWRVRVSSVASLYGDSIVIHILDNAYAFQGFRRSGVAPEVQSEIEDCIVQPSGLFVVAGPPGAGKTTLLFAILHKLNSRLVKIYTVEDAIECSLGGIAQVTVDARAGLDVRAAIQAVLCHDPDIVAVGEMRDPVSAQSAVDAALAGRLVLSTLNAPDALGALLRLSEMGIGPRRLAQVLSGIVAERLLRAVCPECTGQYTPEESDLRWAGFTEKELGQVRGLSRGRGCDACRGTGYRGRLGIFQMLRVNEEIAELVARQASLADLNDAAAAAGMRSLREEALQKIREGRTTPEEVVRVLGATTR